ncbi:MAG: enoyl-CoA hydratase/isomerase family protein [Nitrososphaerales archaeon]
MFKFIIFERKQDYAKITINRPEVMNALNIELRKEIIEALSGVEKDEQVRAVVLTGAGEKAFSAGADIKMFQTMTPFIAKEYLKTSKGASSKIENFPKPVIAAVNGYAIGGGLELAMSCDIIIASDNAKFGQGEINVGAIPGVGGTQRLPRLVGLKKAKEMIFTGELVDAKTALEMGLVNHVVPKSELMKSVEELVSKIATKSPLIITLAKEALNRSAAGLKDGLDYESTLFALCFGSNDQKEGANAFLEKRAPIFKGN